MLLLDDFTAQKLRALPVRTTADLQRPANAGGDSRTGRELREAGALFERARLDNRTPSVASVRYVFPDKDWPAASERWVNDEQFGEDALYDGGQRLEPWEDRTFHREPNLRIYRVGEQAKQKLTGSTGALPWYAWQAQPSELYLIGMNDRQAFVSPQKITADQVGGWIQASSHEVGVGLDVQPVTAWWSVRLLSDDEVDEIRQKQRNEARKAKAKKDQAARAEAQRRERLRSLFAVSPASDDKWTAVYQVLTAPGMDVAMRRHAGPGLFNVGRRVEIEPLIGEFPPGLQPGTVLVQQGDQVVPKALLPQWGYLFVIGETGVRPPFWSEVQPYLYATKQVQDDAIAEAATAFQAATNRADLSYQMAAQTTTATPIYRGAGKNIYKAPTRP